MKLQWPFVSRARLETVESTAQGWEKLYVNEQRKRRAAEAKLERFSSNKPRDAHGRFQKAGK